MMLDEIKERLRSAIKACGLSQKELAQLVGVNPATISKYVHKEKFPSADTLAKLCRALNVKSDAILGLEPFPDQET